MSSNESCPCGSAIPYSTCCGPYLEGQTPAPTAEALMRSRYTAYVKGDNTYLLASWHKSTRPSTMDSDTLPAWQGLKVMHTEAGGENDQEGTVEFQARYSHSNHQGMLHEVSSFVKEDNNWYYVDGELLHEPVRISAEKKVGRNAPCPCGSGKKYKKCCGR
ncbi:MAG: YchJ family metal-binding protein [Desulfobulbaceae bacterium]|nr:YchJ family metal-binding protein [Desulfobulbaceae bacterium]